MTLTYLFGTEQRTVQVACLLEAKPGQRSYKLTSGTVLWIATENVISLVEDET